jgi:2-polyprenyl-3-methyl-5-hydroxy-6-metoxy-1,4-benzoquinol methylase
VPQWKDQRCYQAGVNGLDQDAGEFAERDLMRVLVACEYSGRVRDAFIAGGTILDGFMGSGSTGKAAALEGFSFVGIDLDPENVQLARERINFARR